MYSSTAARIEKRTSRNNTYVHDPQRCNTINGHKKGGYLPIHPPTRMHHVQQYSSSKAAAPAAAHPAFRESPQKNFLRRIKDFSVDSIPQSFPRQFSDFSEKIIRKSQCKYKISNFGVECTPSSWINLLARVHNNWTQPAWVRCREGASP